MANHNSYIQMLVGELATEIDRYIEAKGRGRTFSAIAKLVDARVEIGMTRLDWFEDEGWREMEESDDKMFNLGYWLTAIIDARIKKSMKAAEAEVGTTGA